MKRTCVALLLFVIVAVYTPAVNAVTITFDPLTSTTNTFLPSYEESGFLFSVKTGLGGASTFMSPGSTATSYYAGSAALSPSAAYGVTTLTRTDGGLFDLTSIDLSEWFSNRALDRTFPSWYLKTFTGTFEDGTHATFIATLDNIFGFQTFNFGNTFNDVVSVVWANNPAYYQFDNVVASPTGVPEPASLFLLGLGLVGLAGVKRKLSKRQAI